MVLRIRTSVSGVSGAVKSMGRLVNWGNVILPQVTFEQSEEGKAYAASIAPKKTGELINAIGTTAGGRGRTGWSIVSRIPKNQKTPRGTPRTIPRPYHMFMHGIPAKGFPYYDTGHKIESGDPRYMETTAKYLAVKYPEKILNSLNKQIR